MNGIKKLVYTLAIVMFSVVALLSSCDKSMDEPVTFEEHQNQAMGTKNGSFRASSSSWNGYPLLVSTGNNEKYFSAGIYAVKISRSWYNGTLTKNVRAAQSPFGGGEAYCSVTRYDENGNILESYGPTLLDESNQYIAEVSISGKEYLVIILDVRVSAN